jgi:ATP-dependent helicase/nuclease subunit B
MPDSRQIISSSRAAERMAAARDWLRALDPGTEAAVIAPTRPGADDLVRALAVERGALAGIHRLTFNRIAGLLAADKMTARGLAPASEMVTRAIAALALFHLRPDARLEYFAPVIDQPGFADALARTLEELRLGKISAGNLAALGVAGLELGAMLVRFEAELADAKLADRAMILTLAAETVRGDPPSRFVGIPTLLLDVALESRGESALIAALAARAPNVFATVPAGDERTARMLSEALGVAVRAAPVSASGAATSLARMQDHLFGDLTPLARDLDESVTVISAPGEMHECVEIARRIDREARAGVRFDRIAVLLHDPVRYAPCLQEALDRAAIPVHFALGARTPRPGGRALLALLACAVENLSARRYAEYLALAQVPGGIGGEDSASAASCSELFATSLGEDLRERAAPAHAREEEELARAPRRWEQLIVDAAVIGSAERWARRLGGLEHELARRRAELDDDSAGAAALGRRISDLRNLKEIALPHIAMLAALPKSAPWGEWLARIRALVYAAIRDRDDILSALAELDPMAEVGPASLDEVRHVLAARLARLEDPPAPRRYGAVFVTSPHRARAMSFEVVIVAGLAERIFPQKLTEDPILLDTARAALSGELIRNEDRVARERLALRIAAGAAERRVTFSYPRVDLDLGRPRVPSFYALEVLRAAEGRLPGYDELARRASAPASTGPSWPAPADPNDAIDAAEFDLAVLEQLAGKDPAATRGAAHYLLGANEYLGRALRTRARRWLRRWTSADGLVDPESTTLAALGRHQLAARSYSPTALQNFAACPYKFFLQAIHRLEPREDPVAIEVIDPLTRGGLFAEVQYEILSRLRAARALPVSSAALDAASALLDETLDKVAGNWREELAPAIERVWLDGIESIRADLREWLRRAALDPELWRPERFELAFGLSGRSQADPASSSEPAALDGGLMLRGSIDLIERAPDGRLRVTDHKTGRVRAKPDFVIGGGKYLQPVLYALAAERVLGEPLSAGRLYYCTAVGGYEERIVAIDDAARGAEREFAAIVGQALSDGFLPAAPADRECEWCDYRRVCGPYEERRVKDIKPPARLAPLLRLRKMK